MAAIHIERTLNPSDRLIPAKCGLNPGHAFRSRAGSLKQKVVPEDGVMTPPLPVPPSSGRLAPIAEEECWQLLGTTTVGRLAFTTDAGIEILPLNFIVFERQIYYRTEAGSAIAELAEGRDDVAFEVDYHDDLNQSGWSVLVKGSTAEAAATEAARALASTGRLGPWAPGNRSLVIVLSPRTLSGRKVSMH